MNDPINLRLCGATLALETVPGSDQDKQLRHFGVWERHITFWAWQFLRRVSSPVVFDVGANIGYYSVLTSKLGAAQVVAFEPNPAVRAVLARNVERNGCTAVTVEGDIVAAPGESLRLTVPGDRDENAYAVTADAETAAPTVTIDEYCAASGLRPSMLKIDAEGRDLDVLQGAIETLGKARTAVVFELQSCKVESISRTKPADIFPALRSIGYAPYLFKGHSTLAVNLVDFEILERIYDLAVAARDAGHWDVLLWPAGAPSIVKRFKET